jgi:hypothetical protein
MTHVSQMAHDRLYGATRTQAREQPSIFSTADSILSAHRSECAIAAARDPNFDPETFVMSADTLYICLQHPPFSSTPTPASLILASSILLASDLTRRRRSRLSANGVSGSALAHFVEKSAYLVEEHAAVAVS